MAGCLGHPTGEPRCCYSAARKSGRPSAVSGFGWTACYRRRPILRPKSARCLPAWVFFPLRILCEMPKAADRQKWLALWAAMLGYMLDALDVLLYVFAVQTLRAEFHWPAATAGLVSSATLIASAVGGIGAGILADRIGRTRTLVYTILLYSLGSAGSATSAGLWSLLAWRGVVGLGLGGEWSAGAVLVSETWPPEHRAKAIGVMQSGWAIGYMLAAGATALILPRFGWRVLFLIGILPAFLSIWI